MVSVSCLPTPQPCPVRVELPSPRYVCSCAVPVPPRADADAKSPSHAAAAAQAPAVDVSRERLFAQCYDALLRHHSTESFHTSSVDYCLVGLLRALRYLRVADPHPTASPDATKLLHFVYSRCLFSHSRGDVPAADLSSSGTLTASPDRGASHRRTPSTPSAGSTAVVPLAPGEAGDNGASGSSGDLNLAGTGDAADTALGSLCKTDASRVAAFALLLELSRSNKKLALEHLRLVAANDDDGGHERQSWSYDPAAVRRLLSCGARMMLVPHV